MKAFFQKTLKNISDRAESSEYQYIPFGIFGFVSNPIYYFIWINATVHGYENIYLRAVASILCVPLILKNHLPEQIKKYLPYYWFIVLTYYLPFFFTFMLFKNGLSHAWQLNTMSALVWGVLLVDAVSLFWVTLIGLPLGLLCYWLTTPDINLSSDYIAVLITFSSVFVFSALFAVKKEKFHREKLNAATAVGSSIAHEIRTPIRSVQTTFVGLKRYFSSLMKSHQLAKEAGLPVDYIRRDHYQALERGIAKTEEELDYSHTIVDMLLMNVSQRKSFEHHKMEDCSMQACIEHMLKRYPFSSKKQVSLIHVEKGMDFHFTGNELLMVHVLFNLLKNALHFIGGVEKGAIYISLEKGDRYNYLYFKDTGTGIPKHIVSKLFTRFFTTTKNGTGLGLALCKMVMESFNGSITCTSQVGSYTKFTLRFPKLRES